MQASRLIFIVGPTASGKTRMALEEAERTGASILSCDSLCVYRGMDIGTAKPTVEERARIPHFGIDLTGPDKPYSIADYIAYRDGILGEHAREGRPVIVAGGSGFYLKSFFRATVDTIEIPDDVVERVARIREASGLSGLVGALKSLHPGDETFPGLDLANPRRVEKALLRCLASGRTHGELALAFAQLPEPLPDWKKEVWLLDRPAEELRERNRRRVRAMLDAGLIEEVGRLRERGFERNPSACGAIGYREVLAYLDGGGCLDDLEEAIYTHTNQLMRKQRSWFRHQIPIHRRICPGKGSGSVRDIGGPE